MCSTAMLVVVVTLSQWLLLSVVMVAGQGSWRVMQGNAGISSMHTAVMNTDQCVLLDRTNVGPSKIKLPRNRCREQRLERISKVDCFAHSVMLNPADGVVRPLFIFTDTWCSSGQFLASGQLVQTGGDFEGNRKIRTLTPCRAAGNCDWVETNELLTKGRWYASNHILPGGNRQIVVGGRNEPTYEFVPKRKATEGVFPLGVLNGCCDNLYPFVFLLPSGDLYVFANQASVNLNIITGKAVKVFPNIPGNPRNYPSGGSAAMLPLKAPFNAVEILVCGGAAAGASRSGNAGAPASASCGRISPTAGVSRWEMDNMPVRRAMGDMINMPTGEIMIINGAQNGFQSWGKASNPVFTPVKYNGDARLGARFQVMAKTGIARMYHSTANLLVDGRIMVAGSNTHQFYTYTGAFPTELRVEAFSPPYLGANFDKVRPRITTFPKGIGYSQNFAVSFTVATRLGVVEVNLLSAPFVTHNFAQGQRALKLVTKPPVKVGAAWSVMATGPPSPNVAPQQYYMMFVLQNGIPSERSVWVRMG